MENVILNSCHKCGSTKPPCGCKPLEEGFMWSGTKITRPNLCHNGIWFVNPCKYYGDAYINHVRDEVRGGELRKDYIHTESGNVIRVFDMLEWCKRKHGENSEQYKQRKAFADLKSGIAHDGTRWSA